MFGNDVRRIARLLSIVFACGLVSAVPAIAPGQATNNDASINIVVVFDHSASMPLANKYVTWSKYLGREDYQQAPDPTEAEKKELEDYLRNPLNSLREDDAIELVQVDYSHLAATYKNKPEGLAKLKRFAALYKLRNERFREVLDQVKTFVRSLRDSGIKNCTFTFVAFSGEAQIVGPEKLNVSKPEQVAEFEQALGRLTIGTTGTHIAAGMRKAFDLLDAKRNGAAPAYQYVILVTDGADAPVTVNPDKSIKIDETKYLTNSLAALTTAAQAKSLELGTDVRTWYAHFGDEDTTLARNITQIQGKSKQINQFRIGTWNLTKSHFPLGKIASRRNPVLLRPEVLVNLTNVDSLKLDIDRSVQTFPNEERVTEVPDLAKATFQLAFMAPATFEGEALLDITGKEQAEKYVAESRRSWSFEKSKPAQLALLLKTNSFTPGRYRGELFLNQSEDDLLIPLTPKVTYEFEVTAPVIEAGQKEVDALVDSPNYDVTFRDIAFTSTEQEVLSRTGNTVAAVLTFKKGPQGTKLRPGMQIWSGDKSLAETKPQDDSVVTTTLPTGDLLRSGLRLKFARDPDVPEGDYEWDLKVTFPSPPYVSVRERSKSATAPKDGTPRDSEDGTPLAPNEWRLSIKVRCPKKSPRIDITPQQINPLQVPGREAMRPLSIPFLFRLNEDAKALNRDVSLTVSLKWAGETPPLRVRWGSRSQLAEKPGSTLPEWPADATQTVPVKAASGDVDRELHFELTDEAATSSVTGVSGSLVIVSSDPALLVAPREIPFELFWTRDVGWDLANRVYTYGLGNKVYEELDVSFTFAQAVRIKLAGAVPLNALDGALGPSMDLFVPAPEGTAPTPVSAEQVFDVQPGQPLKLWFKPTSSKIGTFKYELKMQIADRTDLRLAGDAQTFQVTCANFKWRVSPPGIITPATRRWPFEGQLFLPKEAGDSESGPEAAGYLFQYEFVGPDKKPLTSKPIDGRVTVEKDHSLILRAAESLGDGNQLSDVEEGLLDEEISCVLRVKKRKAGRGVDRAADATERHEEILNWTQPLGLRASVANKPEVSFRRLDDSGKWTSEVLPARNPVRTKMDDCGKFAPLPATSSKSAPTSWRVKRELLVLAESEKKESLESQLGSDQLLDLVMRGESPPAGVAIVELKAGVFDNSKPPELVFSSSLGSRHYGALHVVVLASAADSSTARPSTSGAGATDQATEGEVVECLSSDTFEIRHGGSSRDYWLFGAAFLFVAAVVTSVVRAMAYKRARQSLVAEFERWVRKITCRTYANTFRPAFGGLAVTGAQRRFGLVDAVKGLLGFGFSTAPEAFGVVRGAAPQANVSAGTAATPAAAAGGASANDSSLAGASDSPAPTAGSAAPNRPSDQPLFEVGVRWGLRGLEVVVIPRQWASGSTIRAVNPVNNRPVTLDPNSWQLQTGIRTSLQVVVENGTSRCTCPFVFGNTPIGAAPEIGVGPAKVLPPVLIALWTLAVLCAVRGSILLFTSC